MDRIYSDAFIEAIPDFSVPVPPPRKDAETSMDKSYSDAFIEAIPDSSAPTPHPRQDIETSIDKTYTERAIETISEPIVSEGRNNRAHVVDSISI